VVCVCGGVWCVVCVVWWCGVVWCGVGVVLWCGVVGVGIIKLGVQVLFKIEPVFCCFYSGEMGKSYMLCHSTYE
jgi:hypothetical protein